MLKTLVPPTFAAMLALTLATAHAGGWAVVTVEELPDRLVAGHPTTLTFSVRQHGMRLIAGLSAGVSAVSNGRRTEAPAVPAKRDGYYSALLTVPSAGDWTITIHSGFGASGLKLKPIRAVTSSEAAVAHSMPAIERGEALFVAKGCNSCHFHGATNEKTTVGYFRDLTARRYPDEFLAQTLKDPSQMRSANGTWAMPNLQLKEPEIAALVAFINNGRPASPPAGRH